MDKITEEMVDKLSDEIVRKDNPFGQAIRKNI